jgi:hypothetical protein
MLQKYYEMLEKFNKKLEEKDILVHNKSKEFDKSPKQKIIYIKENDAKNNMKKKMII